MFQVSAVLNSLRSVLIKAYGDLPVTIEGWAMHNAQRTTPDEIIAATIAQSFAKDFKSWTGFLHADNAKDCCDNSSYMSPSRGGPERACRIRHSETGTEIALAASSRRTGSYNHKYSFNGLYVNGLEIHGAPKRMIMSAYVTMRHRINAVEKAAADAKSAMERNETAWNLVEKLLKMKRNEHGALVPLVEVGHDNNRPAEQPDNLLRGSSDNAGTAEQNGAVPEAGSRAARRYRPTNRVRERGTGRSPAVSA